MLGFGFAEGHKLLAAGVLVGEKALGEGAILNFLEDLLHRLAAFSIDDARTADVVAPLGRIGDGVAHVGEAAAIDEIDNELELVQALEVGTLRLIAGFNKSFVSRLNEGADAAAQHGLLAEEVGFGLFLECGLERSGARAADALEVAEAERVSFAGCVLMDRDETWNATTLDENLANAMTR